MKKYIILLLMILFCGLLVTDFLYYGAYAMPGLKLKDIDAVTKATAGRAGYDRTRRLPPR